MDTDSGQSDETPRSLRESVWQLNAVHTRLRNLRSFLQSERNTPAEHRRAREAFEQEMDDMAHDDSRSISARASQLRANERRRPYIDVPAEAPEVARVPSPSQTTSLSNGSSPANLVRSRRRAFRSSQRLARNQDRSVQSLPPSSIYNPSARPTSPLPDPPDPYATRDYRSRTKRRKLDDGSYEDESKAITYGHKGQVVPGQLQLEIASCDGGEYQDPDIPTNSWPQNVLQDNALVYCTKSSRCNMLLRHVGGMPFTLTKLVIKAPGAGYDSPIQEGMVFVAMSDENILEKTSRYETNYSPRSYRHHRQHFERTRSSHEYVSSARSPLRTIARTRYLRNPHLYRRIENDPILESAVVPGFDVTTGDPTDDEAPTAPPSPRPWHYNDSEDYRPYVDRYRPQYHEPINDPDDRSTPTSDSEDDLADHLADAAEMVAILNESGEHSQEARRILRGTGRHAQIAAHIAAARADARPLEDDDSDSDASPPPPPPPPHLSQAAPHMPSRRPLPWTANPAEIESSNSNGKQPADSTATSNIMSADAAASSSDMVVPHARFRIAYNKHSVAVHFDPPVYVFPSLPLPSHPSCFPFPCQP